MDLPQIITAVLDKPLKRGDDALATLTFRRPTTVALLDMSLVQIGQADMDAMRVLLVRTSGEGLIAEEVDRIDAADMLDLANEYSAFFQVDETDALLVTIEGDFVTIPLIKPLDDGAIASLRLRRPDSGALRGLSLARVGQMHARTLATMLPRISTTPITEAHTHEIDPADWMRIADQVGDFLLPRRLRTA